MSKKQVVALALVVGILMGLIVGIFFRPYRPAGIVSIDQVNWYPSNVDNPSTPEIEGAYWVITLTVDYTTLSGLKFSKDGITTTNGYTNLFQFRREFQFKVQ
jgi:hypothetical protein